MTPIKLTAQQIAHFDEINMERKAARLAYEVGLQFFENRMNELLKEEQQLWVELAAIHGLNLDEIQYHLERIGGCICIAEKLDD